jgi:rhodanese-related sulfurtransferase
LLAFKETPIVLVCALGRNAGLTGEKLSKKGFTNLTVLKGGISSWQQDNMPLVKP